MDDLRDTFSRYKKDISYRFGRPVASGRERGGGGPNPRNGNVGASDIADENRPDWKLSSVLRAVTDSSDPFGPLKSVVGGLCFILENYEQIKASKQTIDSLTPRVKELTERLCEPVREGDVKEEERRTRLERRLQEVLRDLAPPEMQGKVEGSFNNTENATQLGGLIEGISDAMMEYQASLQQEIRNKQEGVYAKQEDIGKAGGIMDSAHLVLLGRLCHATNAGHLCGNRRECLKGTRNEVLLKIERWLNGEQNQRVFWLNGLAGTGKSAIAQTFAERNFENGKLGASFFCSNNYYDRSNLQTIFPTIAFQLACQYPHFRQKLMEVLKEHPDIAHESLSSQMEKLLVGPLKATQTTTLIIIDALDECKDEEPISAILSILSRYVDQIPTVKFFITGRPEPGIRSGFRLESLHPITDVLKLHEVKPETVDRDIELFFRTQLTELVENRSDVDLTEDWPNPSDIRVLCKKAAGFFAYASAVVKFVATNSLPTDRLVLITSFPERTAEEGRSGLDRYYTMGLQQAFKNVDFHGTQLYSRFQTVVGTVLLLFDPLSIKDLSDLLGCSTQYIRNATKSLHSLLLVPESMEEPIQVFHKSFPDFLMDPNRCEDGKFIIEPAAHHRELLLVCLRLMGERLKKNICNLDNHTVLSKVEVPSTYKKAHIGDALEYACKFWTKHLLEIPNSGSHTEEVQKAIDKFFTVHLLHWVEVLAITGNLDVGVDAMSDIQQWYNVTGVISGWANDTQCFLLVHFDTIHNSPSHIYHSALLLSPSSSWLCKHYLAEASPMVKVVKGLPVGWGACSQTTLLGSYPQALSHHNNSIAVGSESGDIIIINATTGGQSAVLSGHSGEVNCVAFSSNEASLVSGGWDRSVKLWDMQTSSVVKTFSGHTQEIWSVSISADNTTIASGSGDKTINLWDIQKGECYYTIQQQGSVPHVMFSPTDPQYLISILGEKVWQWDVSGCQTSPPFCGTYAAFSSDGAQFVSCLEQTVSVYDSCYGGIFAEFQVVGSAHLCCLSPDNRLVAVAVDKTVYCWDITTSKPQLVEAFIGHTQIITSLIFSSSTILISASQDRSVKFWQVGTQPTDSPIIDLKLASLPSAPIKSVALQSKEGIVVTSGSDAVIKVWDISTGIYETSFQTPAKDLWKRDTKLVNGRFISVWYVDQKIHAWDVENGELLWVVDTSWHNPQDLRISGDGSKVFGLIAPSVWAWSLETGEVVEKMEIEYEGPSGSLIVDGSKVWAQWPESSYRGWDFGIPDSTPVELSNGYPSGNRFWDPEQSVIRNPATNEVVFQLSGRFASPVDVQCDGPHLVAGYQSGEILILNLTNVK